MKRTISFTKENFPGNSKSGHELSFTRRALIRAVVAAGRKMGPGGRKTVAAKADIDMCVNALISAVDLTSRILRPTKELLSCGSTDKAHKSFYVGNALCAHSAFKELSIPWLANFEALGPQYKITKKHKKKRPDFLGLDCGRKWYAFEAKGRSGAPTKKSKKAWKTQATAVKAVNGKEIEQGIISAAYINSSREWELLWVDPPPEGSADSIELELSDFFEAYYKPIVDYIARGGEAIGLENVRARFSGDARVFIGLHRTIQAAYQSRDVEAFFQFARDHADTIIEPDGSMLFPDGLMIRLGTGWDSMDGPQETNLTGALATPARTSFIGKSEQVTQERVIRLFVEELNYSYLGDWVDREGNSNIEQGLLAKYLKGAGYSDEHISAALHRLTSEAHNTHRSLYDNNKAVYALLRYGVDVQVQAGKQYQKVKLINWDEPQRNDFVIVQEVTLKGGFERRPDLVLYVNGIAVGVIELKRSIVGIGDGMRQLLSNQKPEFNAWFFSTVQIVFAGNDSEGLQYGTIGTPEKMFLKWKEDEQENDGYKIDKYLTKLCRKDRLIELMHDFVLFDGGVKKLPRVHQYFGIKAAQQNVRERKGGIIWHTQGSGKSIVMVLLAKWILEDNPNSRVVIITDRDELDKQIKGVFTDAGEDIYRTSSGRDLMKKLAEAKPRLLCSLVHKFGKKGVDDFDAFIKEIESKPTATVGEVFVFVDECHRTQSGKLHRAMKAMMPNAVFIGFTGTPLLKKDKHSSLEVFGRYIHTYKFSEAVDDEVVLDLIYEARDIDQKLGSEDKIEAWFEAKTKGLNHWQKDELKKKWGTMQAVLSSKSRIERVVQDIIFDFSVKPRLSSQRGNAILVASSIYEACKYYDAFQKTELKGRCAVITSYDPLAKDVTKEETGANSQTDKQFIYDTYIELLKDVQAKPGMSKTESYEEDAKDKFITQPANMKLLIVVDKLLTGFDAPPCTYLYIDKSMQDHGLFQAICRTNRLDGDDKEFGYIVDYKSLLKKVEKAIKDYTVYTSELDDSAGGADPAVLMKDRLAKGRERLDEALEVVALLCEPVEPPKHELQYIHYFCGNTEIAADLAEREPQRAALYKAVASLARAYAGITGEMEEAGYSADDVKRIKKKVEEAVSVRDIVRLASGEVIDLKAYEADMRHLIDTYIEADEPRKISPFDNISLLDLIVKTGIADAIEGQLGNLKDRDAIAETIENNVRAKIVKEHLNDPAYYDRISALLDEIIKARKTKALNYEAYLKQVGNLIKNLVQGKGDLMPPGLDTPGKRALYNNVNGNEDLALRVDEAVKASRHDGWRGVEPKERVIKAAMYKVLNDEDEVERLFAIVKAQREY